LVYGHENGPSRPAVGRPRPVPLSRYALDEDYIPSRKCLLFPLAYLYLYVPVAENYFFPFRALWPAVFLLGPVIPEDYMAGGEPVRKPPELTRIREAYFELPEMRLPFFVRINSRNDHTPILSARMTCGEKVRRPWRAYLIPRILGVEIYVEPLYLA